MEEVIRHNGYIGSVNFNIEDDCLHGKILHINDLITYEASTPSELQKAFEESIEDYLETCKQIGKDPDKAYSGTLNVRIGPERHRCVAIGASIQGISINEWISTAVSSALECAKEVHHHHESHTHFHVKEAVSTTEKVDWGDLSEGQGRFKLERANV